MDATENTSEKDSTQCVKVAVNIRPLINSERLQGCKDCISVIPGEPQVQLGNHAFTFDHVYGSMGSPSSAIYGECVAPLVDALFHGYNATVLAYGQTGSGKTYTMGTSYSGDTGNEGIIPKVMESIFEKVDELKSQREFLIRVSFIEIFKEEVHDLLDPSLSAPVKADGFGPGKILVPPRVPIQIRETANGGITLAGVTEAEVRSIDEMASYLAQGSMCRATGSTNMNSESSRSHAIFTITMEQKRTVSYSNGPVMEDDGCDDFLCAKLHLVDLAGSERAKRTGADGSRFKEGIHINKGLLALGNVISALGDEKKRKEGGHVPYRDSKLTRLLQDSLGGNSKTVMIACVSPADTNAEETLNTLKYANRARNIQNKAIINRDPMVAQMQRMRLQLEQLQAELLYSRGEGVPFEELQVLRHKISVLEVSNTELQQELQETRITCDRLARNAIDAQVEKDQLLVKMESVRNGKSWDEVEDDTKMQDFDLMKSYVVKIQELEGEVQRSQSLMNSQKLTGPVRGGFMDCLELEDERFLPKDALDPTEIPSICGSKSSADSGEVVEVEKELEHSTIQDTLGRELQELDKRLEQKEAEMKLFAKADTTVLKQHYEKKLMELEHEKKALMNEMEHLRSELANMSSASDDNTQKLKEEYLQKLNRLEVQVMELKKKQEAQSQLLRQKQKSDEAAKRLQEEIQRIKSQKVQLQHKIKQESEQFRMWKASREKEVLQLKKEGRRNEYEMHKLLALNQRQKMVLQRKTEEASMATKRLKELLEARKASSREVGGGNGNGPGAQVNEKALRQAIEHELEVMVHVHEVRTEYTRQMEARAAMAKEHARLEEEAETLKQNLMSSDCPQAMSPGARTSRILALENMLTTSSSTLVAMASQLSEAEERERVFGGRGRWNQVRSLGDAKNLLNYLFNIASSARCRLRDKEVDCREKDSEIRELKEKVIKLSNLLRQKEAQYLEADMQLQEMQKLAARECHSGNSLISGPCNSDALPYDLRKAPRISQMFAYSGNVTDLLEEDMDTSESDISDESDKEWGESDWSGRRRPKKNRAPKPSGKQCMTSTQEPSPSDASNPQERVNETGSSLEIDNENPPLSIFTSCCSCSRASQCKTKKCECRANEGLCREGCGCNLARCSNRVGGVVEEGGASPPEEMDEEAEKRAEMAAHGAVLLQSALKEAVVEPPVGGQGRRPLMDIGNVAADPKAPKPNQRKKWHKSVVQLVTTTPNPPNSHQTTETHEPNNARETIGPNLPPLKLPRAMRLPGAPLRERNLGPDEEHLGPNRPTRDSDEKENKQT
ncbi:hypothetical protein AMTRI_Chr13g91010 [Amborella trichopoda]